MEKDSDYLQKSMSNNAYGNKLPSHTSENDYFDIDRQESLRDSLGMINPANELRESLEKSVEFKEKISGGFSVQPLRKNSVQDMIFNMNNSRKEFLVDDNMETYEELFQTQLKNYLENVHVSDSLTESPGLNTLF